MRQLFIILTLLVTACETSRDVELTEVPFDPDSGTIEIPVDQIDALVAHLGTEPEESYGDTRVVKIRVAAWATESKAGNKYLKGKVSTPMQQRQAAPTSSDSLPF